MRLTVNRGISIVLIGIAVVYLVMAFQLPEYAFVPVDSDLVPKLLGASLLILGGCFFFAKDTDTEEQKQKRTIPKTELWMLLAVMGLILVFITFLEVIGFVIMTALFIFVCSRLLGYQKWLVNALTSIVFSIGVYWLFNYGLAIRLPAGILPF
ncbi:tripartite tricarboxylate transporter TctB family protein [Shouchella clausii]|uniref:tripartite tricarboxylate transporter TctB family protein n=1 Tax=Shouchella clausii TaxID=79880 RepID=UPI00270C380F|nr:tripartite tricarboxylate transporter TctB family protein [Shouchella clausii]MDO7269384.1 tripartite tricarboxylate transporter TctB family protein [Shouchella clausii]MDO7289266.1 tripartite tricarboxylate transporter TctB family protein [Shouchella clausii]